MSLGGVLSGGAARFALPEEVPAAVEFDFDFFKAVAVGVGESVFVEERVLLGGELLNVVQDGRVVGFFSHGELPLP